MSAWTVTSLGEIAQIERNIVEPSKILSGTTYVGLENIASGGILTDVGPVHNGELKSSKFSFSGDHILFGKLRPYLAKIALPDFEGICSTDIIPIRPGPNADRRYLAHYLRLPSQVALATSRSVGINLPRLSPKTLAEFEVPLPPLPEQRRIAAILDQADALRAKRRAALALLDEMAQAIFVDMFGDPARNPKGWACQPLAKICRNEDSLRVPVKSSERDARPGPFPYYGASGVIDTFDSFIFEGERLLVAEDGANLLSRSTPIAFIAEGRFWVNNHAHVLSENGVVDLRYLRDLLEKTDLSPYVNGSAQPKLTRASLDRLQIPVAPIKLQKEYIKKLRGLDLLKNAASSQGCSLDTLFASLQHRAFRGDL